MNDLSNYKLFDIKSFDPDNVARAISGYIKTKIKECVLASGEDSALQLSSYLNGSLPIRWVQLSNKIQCDEYCIQFRLNPKIIDDYINNVELSTAEYREFKTQNIVLVFIEQIDLNEVVTFGKYPILITSSKTLKAVAKNNNDSLDCNILVN